MTGKNFYLISTISGTIIPFRSCQQRRPPGLTRWQRIFDILLLGDSYATIFA